MLPHQCHAVAILHPPISGVGNLHAGEHLLLYCGWPPQSFPPCGIPPHSPPHQVTQLPHRCVCRTVHAEVYFERFARTAVKSPAMAHCIHCSRGRIFASHCGMSGMSQRHTTFLTSGWCTQRGSATTISTAELPRHSTITHNDQYFCLGRAARSSLSTTNMHHNRHVGPLTTYASQS